MEYASNSHKSKEQKEDKKELLVKKKEKALAGKAKVKKGVVDTFLNEDLDTVKTYILTDVIIPSVKKGLFDIITNGSSMLLFGEKGNASRSSVGSKISYSNYYDRDKKYTHRNEPRTRAKTHDDIIFDNRGDAELVLSLMEETIERYDTVSVNDMYDFAEISAPEWTSDKYGWTNLRNASVKVTRDGYILALPKAMPID